MHQETGFSPFFSYSYKKKHIVLSNKQFYSKMVLIRVRKIRRDIFQSIFLLIDIFVT